MNEFIFEASRWLWDFSLLASVLLVVVLVLGKLIAQPARRMAVHWAAAAGLLFLAVLAAVPGWSVVNLFSAPEQVAPAGTVALEPVVGSAIQTVTQPALELPAKPQVATADTTVVATTRTVAIDYGVLSLYVLTIGSAVVALWLAVGYWQVRRLRRQAQSAPAELESLLTQLATGDARPALGVLEKLPVAVAVGLRRPMILLPQSFLDVAQRENMQTVLAHELAHIRHRDLWLLALLRGLLLLLWPNPLYWSWRRGVRLDQETLADVATAEVTGRGKYAEQLVAWARMATAAGTPRLALSSPTSSVGLWESASQLNRRVAILLDEKVTIVRECSRRWRVGAIAVLSTTSALLSLITVQPAGKAVGEVRSNGEGVVVTNNITATDSAETANLQELVDSYQEIFNKIEALHKVGGVGGETDKLLLAKIHLQNARGKLHEQQQQVGHALRHYEAALKTAEEYVPTAQAMYDSGRIVLQDLLQAQEIRAEARRMVRKAQLLAANADLPDDAYFYAVPVKTELQKSRLGGDEVVAYLDVYARMLLEPDGLSFSPKNKRLGPIRNRLKSLAQEQQEGALRVSVDMSSIKPGESKNVDNEIGDAFRQMGEEAGFTKVIAYGIWHNADDYQWKPFASRADSVEKEDAVTIGSVKIYPVLDPFTKRIVGDVDCFVSVEERLPFDPESLLPKNDIPAIREALQKLPLRQRRALEYIALLTEPEFKSFEELSELPRFQKGATLHLDAVNVFREAGFNEVRIRLQPGSTAISFTYKPEDQ